MYTLQYNNLTVFYEIEGDCDGNHVIINGIKKSNGNYTSVDKETAADIRFLAKLEFEELQFNHYMKTGETI